MSSTRRLLEIAVRELQPGDQVVDKGREVYNVIEVVRDEPTERTLRIQWADGGFDIRVWDGDLLDQRVDIIRAL